MRYTREQACLAWLAQGMLGSRRLKKLLDEYGSAEAAYDAFQRDHGASLQNRISDYSLSLLRASASREKLHDMLVTMRKWNMGLVSMADDMYPESLRNIPEPPYMLFYQGDLRAAEGRCITVIGSRSATVAGIAATKSLCRDLSKQGVCIVSGLAVGIDAAAHEGCLDGGSPTIGVAASGLNVPYPSENVALKARILSQGGLLLSEYPPDMQSSKYVFAARNRILAGLGHAVVLMEARIRSGSMLTVHHALDQGKDVFAYPGIPDAPMSEGAHQLLREGAVYFTSAKDILEDMDWQPAASIPKRQDTGQPRPAPRKKEARIRSGSMLTVHHALDQGKDVFAYPGIPDAPMSEGAHQLLREGAVYFTSAKDILEDMDWQPAASIPKRQDTGQPRPAPRKKETQPAPAKAPKAPPVMEQKAPPPEPPKTPEIPLPPMDDVQKRIYDALADGERSFDQLASQTGLDASKLMASLTMLQILGAVKPLPGKSYCRATE